MHSPFRVQTASGAAVIDAIAADPAATLLGLDFDGTLAPIVEDPFQAVPHPGVMQTVIDISQRLGLTALITGRELAALRRLSGLESFGPLDKIVVHAQHGAEIWDGATGVEQRPPNPERIPIALDQIHRTVQALTAAGHDLGDLLVHDKQLAIAVHHRRTPNPELSRELLKPQLVQIAEQHDMYFEEGRDVFELRASRVDKSHSMRACIEQVKPRVVVMAGDDIGDVPAFDVVDSWTRQGRPGAVVLARSHERPELVDRADVLCDGVHGVAAWLGTLAARLGVTR